MRKLQGPPPIQLALRFDSYLFLFDAFHNDVVAAMSADMAAT
jgi:hypothetical protein